MSFFHPRNVFILRIKDIQDHLVDIFIQDYTNAEILIKQIIQHMFAVDPVLGPILRSPQIPGKYQLCREPFNVRLRIYSKIIQQVCPHEITQHKILDRSKKTVGFNVNRS